MNNMLLHLLDTPIKEEMLSNVHIMTKSGKILDIKTYIKTLIIEALEEATGGKHNE